MVTVFVEDAGVDEFVFGFVFAAYDVFVSEVGIGEFCVWVLVHGTHVGMRGGGVEVEVLFFDVFAVVAFGVGEAEESFFEDIVFAVPESDGEAESASSVRDAHESIFTPGMLIDTLRDNVKVTGLGYHLGDAYSSLRHNLASKIECLST